MGILLAAILLTTAVVLFVLYPLIQGESAPMGREDDEPTEAESRSRVTLLALRDVEYDYVSGKLDDEDYARLRKELSVEALQALEARERELELEGPAADAENGLDELEREIARAREGLRDGTACRACGHENDRGSRFCAHCGTPLPPGATEGVVGGEGAPVGEAGP